MGAPIFFKILSHIRPQVCPDLLFGSFAFRPCRPNIYQRKFFISRRVVVSGHLEIILVPLTIWDFRDAARIASNGVLDLDRPMEVVGSEKRAAEDCSIVLV